MDWIRGPGGVVMHVRRSKPRRHRCAFCDSWASRQCDFVLEELHAKNRTCDKHLCAKHAVSVRPDLDHCPDHALAPGAQPTLL